MAQFLFGFGLWCVATVRRQHQPQHPRRGERVARCFIPPAIIQNATSVAHSESASPTGRLYIQSTAKLNYKKTKAKGPTPHTTRGSSSNPRYDPRRRPRCGRGRDTSLQNWQARSHMVALDGRVPIAGVFVWFGLVWVGLGWDNGWDCARGIFQLRGHFPG